jgi:hypothetical protein
LSAGSPSLQVLRGNGVGGFTPATTVSWTGAPGSDVALFDFDANGRLDLAIAAGAALMVSTVDSIHAFRAPFQVVADRNGVGELAAHDLIGDGRAELVHVSGGRSVGVSRSQAAPFAGLAAFGSGTPDCGGRIGQWATGVPRLGNQQFAYTTTNAPPDTFGFLLLGGPADVAGSDPFQLGVLLHLSFGLVSSRVVFSDPLGGCRTADPVPVSPGLVGLLVHVQTLWQGQAGRTCAQTTSLLSSSVGLTITIQP